MNIDPFCISVANEVTIRYDFEMWLRKISNSLN